MDVVKRVVNQMTTIKARFLLERYGDNCRLNIEDRLSKYSLQQIEET